MGLKLTTISTTEVNCSSQQSQSCVLGASRKSLEVNLADQLLDSRADDSSLHVSHRRIWVTGADPQSHEHKHFQKETQTGWLILPDVKTPAQKADVICSCYIRGGCFQFSLRGVWETSRLSLVASGNYPRAGGQPDAARREPLG